MAAHIHHGPWINWSHGLISGATVTLGEREGGLLTAFIATFVTIVGAELWKIICYTSHQLRSRATAQDGLYHQQQILLKNTGGAAGTAWLFLQQAWCWAGRARASSLRTVPWAVFGALYVGLIGVVAIFSSQISKSPGPMRLIVSDGCGNWVNNVSSPYNQEAYLTKSINDSLVAATYAKACYGGSYDALACSRFPVPSISWTQKLNDTCPFKSGTCLYGDTIAYTLTSKLIDTHTDLGINAPPSERVHLEKSLTCAPLHTKGFATKVNATDDPDHYGRDNDTVLKYYYGEIFKTTNITYWYNDHASWDQGSYTLEVQNAVAGQQINAGAFIPVPALNRTDADVTVLFIAPNSVVYLNPCDDPIFAAHDYVDASSLGLNVQYYNADRYVNVLGCTEQYRICNPNNNQCTTKNGFLGTQNALSTESQRLGLSAFQNATALRMAGALMVSNVYYQTFTRLGASLRAIETLHALQQRYLPPNQWQIEVGSWFDTGLARLQQKTLEYATGPSIVPRGSFVAKPNPAAFPDDLYWQAMCHSQMVNDSSDTMSFSVVGLAVLFGVGVIIIFISLTMDTVVGWLQTRLGKGLHARIEWQINDKLQMQRLLHDEMKLGDWDNSKMLPVTAKGQKFVGPTDKHLDLYMQSQKGDSEDGAGTQLVQERFDDKHDTRY